MREMYILLILVCLQSNMEWLLVDKIAFRPFLNSDIMAAFYMVSTLLAPFTVVIFLCYILALSVYRLFFSPLAKFPGPKLAALTNGYELYYDAVLKGQFTFHMQQLHKKYGR